MKKSVYFQNLEQQIIDHAFGGGPNDTVPCSASACPVVLESLPWEPRPWGCLPGSPLVGMRLQ